MTKDKILKYSDDILWSLPLFFESEPSYGVIHRFLKEMRNIDLPQVNFFGSPKCLWTGGRPPEVEEANALKILRRLDYIKSLNAVPVFTFTNTLLEKEHLKDSFSNRLLDLGMMNGAKFIVCSDMLKDYIKDKYPDACVIASTIKPSIYFQGPEKTEEPDAEKETKYYNKLLEEYDVVVVRAEYSKEHLLNNIKEISDISRIEVIVNSYCLPDCPCAKAHYDTYSKKIIKDNGEFFKCINEDATSHLTHSPNHVNKLVKAGVKRLKLQGRSNKIPPLAILQILLKNMFNMDNTEYCQIFERIIPCNLDSEIQYFNSKLLK